jgi:hypothetical protein
MSDNKAQNSAGSASTDQEKAERLARRERYSQIMWAYVCGAISLISIPFRLEATFIPLAFGVFGLILAWQLSQKGEPRHNVIAGAINLGGILIWFTANWGWLRHFLEG